VVPAILLGSAGACLDPVYVDGIFSEGVVNLGANFATPYFR
jgi:hypothetical protein